MNAATAPRGKQSVTMLSIDAVVEHNANVRDDVGDVTEMAASIRAHGIVQPLIVTEHPTQPSRYLLLAGHRRLAGARLAGLEQVPALVRHGVGDDESLHTALMLVENHQRRQLSPMEKVRAIGRLLDTGMSKAEVSRLTGMHHASVTTYATLLELDDGTAEAVEDGDITAGDAVAAVRRARAERRTRAGQAARGRPVIVEKPHLTFNHPLARAVDKVCAHVDRPRYGNVGCGQCWEDAIRADERALIEGGAEAASHGGGPLVEAPERVAVDDVAIERALDSDRSVRLNRAEQREAVRRLHAAGVRSPVIADRLGLTQANVQKAIERMAARERAS